MKFMTAIVFFMLSMSAFAQICRVNMVDRYNRVIRVFSTYGDPNTCIEGMKECRKTIRLEPHLGGVDCVRSTTYNPDPYPGIPAEVQRMNDIDRGINFALENCHIVPRVSGWANQLYIRGTFAGNYEVGRQDMELTRAIRDYQVRGQCNLKRPELLNIQFDFMLIDRAIDRTLSRNCWVVPRVSGWANQLYVDNQFNGNFDVNSSYEQMKLKATLADLLYSGRCHRRSSREEELMRDPRLIQDFANFQYRGCHVKLNVSGWAHQLYVGTTFSGNFDKNTELNKLQAALVDLVLKGTCSYDPM